MLDKLFGKKGPSMAEAVQACQGNPAARLVDVRSREEYKQGHLPGSLLLPLNDIGRASVILTDKSAPLYVYCLSGARSGMACQMLRQMGFSQVQNIGGIGGYRGELEH